MQSNKFMLSHAGIILIDRIKSICAKHNLIHYDYDYTNKFIGYDPTLDLHNLYDRIEAEIKSFFGEFNMNFSINGVMTSTLISNFYIIYSVESLSEPNLNSDAKSISIEIRERPKTTKSSSR